MATYTLRCGNVVTSKDGSWPTQYANRTQAEKASAKTPGTVVVQRGRPFYVAFTCWCGCGSLQHHQQEAEA